MPDQSSHERAPLTLRDIGKLLLRGSVFIVVLTLLGGAAAFAVSARATPLYTATATEYFAITTGRSASELSLGSNYLQDQMASYGELATSPAVLNPVIDSLGLDVTARQLARSVTVTTPRNTVVMTIDVDSSDPARAATIANAIARQLSVSVGNVAPKLSDGSALVAVQSIQAAVAPNVQSSPNKRRDAALGLLAGLLVACVLVLAADRLDRKVRTPASVAEVTDQPLLGALRTTKAIGGGLVIPEPSTAAHLSADEVRRLRAAVEQRVQTAGGSSVLGVTSAVRREGRSTVAANLAAALAEIGHRTVLVDLDLRSPSVDRLTGTTASEGLVAALDDPAGVLSHVQQKGRLAVLPAAAVASPTAVLGSGEFADLLQRLRAEYEFVVLDTPAILTSADPTDLADLVDGFLVVAGAGRVQRQQLDSALSSADLAGMRVVGVVLNDVKGRDLPSTGTGPSERPAGKRAGQAVSWEPRPTEQPVS